MWTGEGGGKGVREGRNFSRNMQIFLTNKKSINSVKSTQLRICHMPSWDSAKPASTKQKWFTKASSRGFSR